MIEFSTPILYVSPEVVQDLDGEDALYGMWTVFTKCKQSLKDGRRLENMSWRLWYREMSLSHSPDAFTSGTSSPSLSDAGCLSPITPASENGPPNDFAVSDDSSESPLCVPQGPSRHSWHDGDLPPPTSNIRRLSTASMPAWPGTRSHPQQRVGSILMHILPEKVVYPSPTASRRPYGLRKPAPSSNPSPVQTSATSTYVNSSRPRPATSVAQPRPTIAMPTFHLPSTPPTLAAPRVVVNPTPHPTPPATLHPSNSGSAAALRPMSATHLSPPLPHLAFFASKAVPTPPSALSSKLAPGIANQDQSAPLRAEPPVEEVSRVRRDETLKLSDRRLFLESLEPPEKSLPSPERPQTGSPQKSLDLPEPSSASTTSSNVKSEVAPAPPRRPHSGTTVRRGKDVPRFTTARLTGKVQRPTMTRKQTESKTPTFNIDIDSASSNGTKADGHGQHLKKASPAQQRQTQHHSKPASLPKKKDTTVSTSEYCTESDDDSEWASEGNSADEKEKNRQKPQSKVRDAAQEAQRQRDMFSKLPKLSYIDLTQRTRSGLSQLMNPNPSIFPPNHPYHSTTDMKQSIRQHGGQLPPPNYQSRQSSAAAPLAAQITRLNALAPSTNGAGAGASSNAAYRPKGQPQGEELETDTEEEGAENGLQISTSLAQQKLAALAGPSQRSTQDQQTNAPSGLARSKVVAQQRGTIPSVATAPIPLSHPYNLPAPAPPMTPRTTRRHMLSTELSESMRLNVLWERQVSKVNMLGAARRGGGVLGQRLQPLTQAHPQGQGEGKDGQPLDEREERRLAAMARIRSWADDFHCAGW